MPSPLNLYIDETGSRHPDKKSDESRRGKDWFALGGILIAQDDEAAAKEMHRQFCENWEIKHPLHITDMLACRENFSWLGKLKAEAADDFWREYKRFLASVPARGTACVIDRPGYVARGYLEKHKNDRWLLCRSAFDILIERSAKLAMEEGRKLNVIFESEPATNDLMKSYFKNLNR